MIAVVSQVQRMDNRSAVGAVVIQRVADTEPLLTKAITITDSKLDENRAVPALVEIAKLLPERCTLVLWRIPGLAHVDKPKLMEQLYLALDGKNAILFVSDTTSPHGGTPVFRTASQRALRLLAQGISESAATKLLKTSPDKRIHSLFSLAEKAAREAAFTREYALWLLKVLEAHLWELAAPFLDESKSTVRDDEPYRRPAKAVSISLTNLEIDAERFSDEYSVGPESSLLNVWNQFIMQYRWCDLKSTSIDLLTAICCSIIRNHLMNAELPKYAWDHVPIFCEEVMTFGNDLTPPLSRSKALAHELEQLEKTNPPLQVVAPKSPVAPGR